MKEIPLDILTSWIVTRLFASGETVIPIIGKQSYCATIPAPAITGKTIVWFNHPVMYTLFLFGI
jgi:hypothetical protein